MRAIITTLLTAALAVALPSPTELSPRTMPSAHVVIEAGHGENATSTTLMIPIGTYYTNETAFAKVSTLYLLNPSAVTCVPYILKIPTGYHGNPFTVGHPCQLSKEPITIGCVRCILPFYEDAVQTDVEEEQ
ncbi:hypothetical protein ANO14919_072210 [Xylariales sp. No.14919]|nr:hypothetical protein ANO14919_072210 [Xylariales sp. No.14919]